jgi:hypothetical protein
LTLTVVQGSLVNQQLPKISIGGGCIVFFWIGGAAAKFNLFVNGVKRIGSSEVNMGSSGERKSATPDAL